MRFYRARPFERSFDVQEQMRFFFLSTRSVGERISSANMLCSIGPALYWSKLLMGSIQR